MVDLDDLVDQVGIGGRLGIGRGAVNNWTVRYPDFPKPLARFGATPVYSWDAVVGWYISQFGMTKYKAIVAAVS